MKGIVLAEYGQYLLKVINEMKNEINSETFRIN